LVVGYLESGIMVQKIYFNGLVKAQ